MIGGDCSQLSLIHLRGMIAPTAPLRVRQRALQAPVGNAALRPEHAPQSAKQKRLPKKSFDLEDSVGMSMFH